MSYNREKVVNYLDDLLEKKEGWFKDYVDHSSQKFKIELVYRRGEKPTNEQIKEIFSKEHTEALTYNVITHEEVLEAANAAEPKLTLIFSELLKEIA